MTLTDAEFEAMGLVDLGDIGKANFAWVSHLIDAVYHNVGDRIRTYSDSDGGFWRWLSFTL